jgi:hypothetical protein
VTDHLYHLCSWCRSRFVCGTEHDDARPPRFCSTSCEAAAESKDNAASQSSDETAAVCAEAEVHEPVAGNFTAAMRRLWPIPRLHGTPCPLCKKNFKWWSEARVHIEENHSIGTTEAEAVLAANNTLVEARKAWIGAVLAALLIPLGLLAFLAVGVYDWHQVNWRGFGFRLMSVSFACLLAGTATAPFGSRTSGFLTALTGALLTVCIHFGFHGFFDPDFSVYENFFWESFLVIGAVVLVSRSEALGKCDKARELLSSLWSVKSKDIH